MVSQVFESASKKIILCSVWVGLTISFTASLASIDPAAIATGAKMPASSQAVSVVGI